MLVARVIKKTKNIIKTKSKQKIEKKKSENVP